MIATVKGDVHDIGKNIVGVVLGCNNYEVIDLGVMAPAELILDTAIEEGADIVGLSGLITPSLDEMVNVATEMERRGMDLPLLIGGATTSRQHTAVKIAPAYAQPSVHVLDASRVVGVVSTLLDPARKAELDADEPRRPGAPARRCTRSGERRRCSPTARRSRTARRSSGAPRTSRRRRSPARAIVEPALAELRDVIDWTFFFTAWELKGRYPQILDHPQHGEAARELFEHGERAARRDRRATRRSRRAGVYGFWPAARRGRRHRARATASAFPMLRQQADHGEDDDRPNRSLADFVAPPEQRAPRPHRRVRGHRRPRRRRARRGVRGRPRRLPRDHGEGARRPARRGVRRVAPPARRGASLVRAGERCQTEELVAERYRGIRPAFGYPACPDHTEKRRAVRPARGPRPRHRPHRVATR